jgi:hypothetical protein
MAINGDYSEGQQNQFLCISCVCVYTGRASELYCLIWWVQIAQVINRSRGHNI